MQAAQAVKQQAIVRQRDKLKKEPAAAGRGKLKKMEDSLRKSREVDTKERTIHYHALVHRLVAAYFVKPKSSAHMIVGHLDYNKMNNKAATLRWMTPEGNSKHQ